MLQEQKAQHQVKLLFCLKLHLYINIGFTKETKIEEDIKLYSYSKTS